MKQQLHRLIAFARRDPETALIFALAAVATLLPVWIGRYLPLLDYPNHLSMVYVWRHLDDPAMDFSRFYETHLVPLPYWAQYGAIYLLSIPFPIEIAQKLFLSGALLSLPVGAALYARQMGRDPRLSIFAFALAWNYNATNGFLAYLAGTGMLFFALTALDRHAESPSLRRGLWAASLGAMLYFFHILSWGTFLAIGGVTALLAPRRPGLFGRFVLGPLPTLPALAVGLWAYRASQSMNVKMSPLAKAGLSSLHMLFYEPAGVLHNVPDWLINVHAGQADEAVAIGLSLCWILLLATRGSALRHAPGGPHDRADLDDGSLRSFRLEVGALIAAALLFDLPRTLFSPFYWYAINTRLAVVLAVLCTLAVRGPIAGARRPVYLLAAAVSIFFGLNLSVHMARFNQRALGFDEVMSVVPAGKTVLPLMMTLGDNDLNVNCYNQWGSYVQLRQGGFVPFNFEIDFPIHRKRGRPAPPWDHPDRFSFASHAAGWDYFLIHLPAPNDTFEGHHDDVRLVKSSGEWELWQKLATPNEPTRDTR